MPQGVYCTDPCASAIERGHYECFRQIIETQTDLQRAAVRAAWNQDSRYLRDILARAQIVGTRDLIDYAARMPENARLLEQYGVSYGDEWNEIYGALYSAVTPEQDPKNLDDVIAKYGAEKIRTYCGRQVQDTIGRAKIRFVSVDYAIGCVRRLVEIGCDAHFYCVNHEHSCSAHYEINMIPCSEADKQTLRDIVNHSGGCGTKGAGRRPAQT